MQDYMSQGSDEIKLHDTIASWREEWLVKWCTEEDTDPELRFQKGVLRKWQTAVESALSLWL